MEFELILPSQIIFGCGKSLTLDERVAEFGVKTVVVVTSNGMVNREKPGDVIKLLKKAGLNLHLYSQVPPEPSLDETDLCARFAKEHQVEMIIGLGGGSALDVAKKAAMDLALPMIMLPTTAGTGSEVTHESVLKVDGKKKAFINKKLLPDIAIVDPELAMTMPLRLAFSCGIDALAHAAECAESKRSNPAVMAIALQAFELLKENIGPALEGGREAKINMSLGSMMSGLAFGNSGTTLAHALSYPLSNRGMSHGEAIGMVLSEALKFNSTDLTFATELNRIVERLDYKWDASWDIKEMAEEVIVDTRHLDNNPRPVNYDDILQMLTNVKNLYN